MSTTEVDIEVYTLQVTTLSSRRVKIRYDDVTVSNRVNLVDPTYVRTNVPTPPALCLGTPVPRQKLSTTLKSKDLAIVAFK